MCLRRGWGRANYNGFTKMQPLGGVIKLPVEMRARKEKGGVPKLLSN